MGEVDYSSKQYLDTLDKYWRAVNYISVGQLYLLDNPLLKEPLKADDVKIKVVGHWGTITGQTFIYAHLNRVINKYDLDMFYIEGPGHGGQVMVSNSYLDGSYSEIYPNVSQDINGLKKLFKQFSFPGGISSHAAPETPGSIHEGGELGYSLSHASGAALDNPELIVAAVVGDGEAETGPLAGSWQFNKFLNPINDGAVLPIIDLNGYKISNPTVMSRMTDQQLTEYFAGLGYEALFIEGEDPQKLHPEAAKVMDQAIEKIKAIQENARKNNDNTIPTWPVVIVRTPKGWTGPKTWDGVPIENSFRSHQVPIPVDRKHMEHADKLVEWMKSYKPEELFSDDGKLLPEIAEITPKGDRRMAMNPHTNGGKLLKELKRPNYKDYAVDNSVHGSTVVQDMEILGGYVRDVMTLNDDNKNFRIWGPDETMSNRLFPVFEKTNRQWEMEIKEPNDQFLAPQGRVIDSLLSEHMDEGMLEGYLLTGRHGFWSSYESFLRVVDSMVTQHQKWYKITNGLAWRRPVASLNLISTSVVWQQDHNGYTHQDPGMLGHLADKKRSIIREYLPADANSLLAVFDKSIQTHQKINYIVASKQPREQWYSIEEATKLVQDGLGIIDWASTDQGQKPDVVFAGIGSEPNTESLAAISILNDRFPELKIRYINVVDLLKLSSPNDDPRGLSDADFNSYFTKDAPVIINFHGYKGMIRELIYDRDNKNVSVHGYEEEGSITTPFDMRVQNRIDRFHLVIDAIEHIPSLGDKGAHVAQEMRDTINEHNNYIREVGADLPVVTDWKWTELKK